MTTSILSPGSHYFQSDGLQLHYAVRGQGPLAVLQSVGWGLSGAYLWNGLGPHLERKRTVVYLEPRGNGDSEKPANASTMTAKTMMDDLDRLRVHLGLEAYPTLMGHSHGGAIALGYAQRFPERVCKLANLDYAACLSKMGEVFAAGGSQSDENFLDDLSTMVNWHFSDVSKAYLLLRDIAGIAHPVVASAFQTNQNDALERNKLLHIAEAGRVQAKTLLLLGEEDTSCPPEDSQAVAEAMQDARIVVIPSVGHFAWYEALEPFWGTLLPFLDE
ncbi:Alpha/Beta hydrolase protein [Emericellopsis atlantica]|uniref:Alpha/Beta hydrolase protein n=1 Tax=Emericellopsis atlantica TaxID=2614577 RepID=A0A9P8CN11_9HYPO|nr:Alpha/Beta hydrolase protein [Emericellopsis atlantica]KAG9253003.1 Alpha/Beta hydrolase protein [Emericellopsis atlantica]